jgi:hypothetical protein
VKLIALLKAGLNRVESMDIVKIKMEKEFMK